VVFEASADNPEAEEASLPRPTISSVQPKEVPTQGGIILKITGENFGSVKDDVRVMVAGRPCKIETFLPPKEILCRAPAGVGHDNYVSVIVASQWNDHTNSPVVHYQAPTLKKVQAEATLQEQLIVCKLFVEGENLGSDQYTIKLDLFQETSVKRATCANFHVSEAHHSISCTLQVVLQGNLTKFDHLSINVGNNRVEYQIEDIDLLKLLSTLREKQDSAYQGNMKVLGLGFFVVVLSIGALFFYRKKLSSDTVPDAVAEAPAAPAPLMPTQIGGSSKDTD